LSVGGLKLAVVGLPKPTDEFEMQLLKQIWTCPEIQLLGNLSDHELDRQVEKASVILYLSGSEGYGLPVLEGRAAGKPVVCLDTPINQYFQTKYGGLFLVPHKDGNYNQEDLSQAIIKALIEGAKRPTNLPVDEELWASDVFHAVFPEDGAPE
jgi:glycosyltransferase involved in cell wall biosynthesis